MRKPEYRCPDCGKTISDGESMCWWCEDNSATGREKMAAIVETQGSNIGILFDAFFVLIALVCTGFIIIGLSAN